MKIFILFFGVFLSSSVFSGTTSGTKISYFVVQPENEVGSNRVCVYLDKEIDNSPVCNVADRLCASIDSDLGRAQLSTIMYAHSMQKSLTINGLGANGTGICTVDANSQDLGYILVEE
ncbi:hypothetical protein [Gilvimarinus algae]|uniref:Uncharacterized protein n=1 Tax=Gilvimarinus algae TaxID=3058037 RepID=A0ABT8TE56_9GAMM|nr:hypothetical protein [Gilvimarinus sp. SDUM040014]MDO3382382.1 hypothetical protein [Gilvimarinus sp. SDUM040014]